jgi:cell division control protein 24
MADQPPGAEPLDVVSHMCHTFRLGSPLCHLYNLLIPTFTDPSSPLFANVPAPKQIEYDFPQFIHSPDGVKNWAKRPENAKICQKYIAMFCMAMKQRTQEGRWHGEIWAIHELWGKSTGDEAEGYDSTGLMKVLQTIETMLDHLPESAMSPVSPPTPYTAHRHLGSMSASSNGHGGRESYDIPFSMGGMGSGASAVTNLAAAMNGGVRISDQPTIIPEGASTDINAYKSVEELVGSEKSYVQELEILVRCSNEMLQKQLISAETCHKMFANLSKILEFHVRLSSGALLSIILHVPVLIIA